MLNQDERCSLMWDYLTVREPEGVQEALALYDTMRRGNCVEDAREFLVRKSKAEGVKNSSEAIYINPAFLLGVASAKGLQVS